MNEKTLPPVGLSSIQMRPPCVSVTRRQKVKPKPVPRRAPLPPPHLHEAVKQDQLVLVRHAGSRIDHVDADETGRRAFRARLVRPHDHACCPPG